MLGCPLAQYLVEFAPKAGYVVDEHAAKVPQQSVADPTIAFANLLAKAIANLSEQDHLHIVLYTFNICVKCFPMC